MQLDRAARGGLIWVGLWGVVFFGMVINAAVNHYSLGAYIFAAVFVVSVCWWYGNLSDRAREREREEALRASGFDRIDRMTGVEFEEYFAAVLRGLGHEVTMTRTTGDFGVDLIAIKHGKRTAVQCKRKGGGAVGGVAVQQVVAGAPMHGCGATMVVTNNLFTRAAQQLAAVHSCELVDRWQLKRLVLDASTHTSSTRATAGSAPSAHPTSTQADSDLCTGVNGLQNRGEDFYRSCRRLMRTDGESVVAAQLLSRQLRTLATVGAPPGQTDGSAAINAASPEVRLPLVKVVRAADRLAQRFADIANGSPASGVDRELTALIDSFSDALMACARAGHAPAWFDPDDLLNTTNP
ncbi:MAG: restriction endonuclease [Mycobacterium sp.]